MTYLVGCQLTGRTDGLIWCENIRLLETPHPQYDLVCERPEKTVALTVNQTKDAYKLDKCLGIRLHYDYSIIERVIKPVMKSSGRTLQLVTQLRDPVRRMISAYFYSYGSHPTDSLRQFMKRKDLGFQKYGGFNHQAKQLAGVLDQCSQYSTQEKQKIQKDLLVTAIEHLETFDDIMILEKRTESLECLRRKYNWTIDFDVPNSDSKHSKLPSHVNFTDEELQLVREANEIDMAVYEHGLKLFQQRCHDV